MDYLDLIIKIGAVITAIVIIWKAIVFFVKLANNIKSLIADVGELKEHSQENYLGIKRLTVMSPYMPLGERIVAGNDYINNGGNGEVKKYIITELHSNEIQHD